MKVFPLLALVSFVMASCALNRSNDRSATQRTFGASISDENPGRTLFLKNCAHCHGADAHGDEGPDLHNLDWSNEQIATRIRSGKKGEMTAFAEKLSKEDIGAVVGYLRQLK